MLTESYWPADTTSAERTARALLGRFAPGERVAVNAANCPEWTLRQVVSRGSWRRGMRL